MTPTQATTTTISGVYVLSREVSLDARGHLEKIYDSGIVKDTGAYFSIQQVNRTYTRLAGTVRGMHLQLPPNAEYKVVSCVSGRVFDVAVDLRRKSPTFLQWVGVELSDSNHRSLLLPPGCAHAVQTLETDCELIYLHSAPFVPGSEAGLNPLNRSVGIKWPLRITSLSDRDREEATEPAFFEGVDW